MPDGFRIHRTVQRFPGCPPKAIDSGEGIDWATGEALAFCSLMMEGHHVRLSGRTPSAAPSRSAIRCCSDQEDESRYTPFNHLGSDQTGRYEVINSLLSEEAVLGFEYGYSLAEPNALALWKRSSAISPTVRRCCSTSSSRRRTQVAAHVGPRLPAAAWLRRPGAGSFLRAPRALPANVRRRQHAGRQPDDAGELLPRPAPPVEGAKFASR